MKYVKVKDLFTLQQGNSLELMHLETSPLSDVNFISRTSQENGVVAQVDTVDGIAPFPAGLISVALSGNGVCSAFVQTKAFYTAYHIMVLSPKRALTLQEKLFYCLCIKRNAYKYCWGRQANRTLQDIEVPDIVPAWASRTPILPVRTAVMPKAATLRSTEHWRDFRLCDLFDAVRGTRITKETRSSGTIPLVTAGFQNQGIAEYIETDLCKMYSNRITIDMFGNSFYRNYAFYCDDNILVLTNKYELSIFAKLFVVTILNADRYRYSYGKQYRQKDFRKHLMKLPALSNGSPDWAYMEQYIKSLPYSDRI